MKISRITSALLLAAVIVCVPTVSFAQPRGEGQDTISVLGEGEAFTEPDVAVVRLGVETRNESVRTALAENRSAMDEVLDAIESLGINRGDAATFAYSVHFEPRMPVESPNLEGVYRVSNMLEVRTSQLNSLGVLLETAVEAGANQIWGISYERSSTKDLQESAREMALADARRSAEHIAAVSGRTVGRILSIEDSPRATGGRVSIMEGRGGGPQIMPGGVRVYSVVQVTYELE